MKGGTTMRCYRLASPDANSDETGFSLIDVVVTVAIIIAL